MGAAGADATCATSILVPQYWQKRFSFGFCLPQFVQNIGHPLSSDARRRRDSYQRSIIPRHSEKLRNSSLRRYGI